MMKIYECPENSEYIYFLNAFILLNGMNEQFSANNILYSSILESICFLCFKEYY